MTNEMRELCPFALPYWLLVEIELHEGCELILQYNLYVYFFTGLDWKTIGC